MFSMLTKVTFDNDWNHPSATYYALPITPYYDTIKTSGNASVIKHLRSEDCS